MDNDYVTTNHPKWPEWVEEVKAGDTLLGFDAWLSDLAAREEMGIP